jgi:FkbM family methyltransferase
MHMGLKKLLKRTPLYPLYRSLQHRRQVRDYWQWGTDDEKRAAFYKEFVSPGDLVFDVGANRGNRAKVFCKLGARVVAFEPQLDCYHFLRGMFAGEKSVRLVNQALGRAEGVTEMLIADADTISSLSPEWVEAVQRSGRFSQHKWDRKQQVTITTLDAAIRDFGTPSFIKIDVEGYESEVLSGLSTPVKCVAVEFVPECVQNTMKCIDHLSSLSAVEAKLSLGESMEFETPSWLSADEIKRVLNDHVANADHTTFGDVYIRSLDKGR